MGKLMSTIDSYDLIQPVEESCACDSRAHEETWQDMIRLQETGVYPSSFRAIKVPVLLLHGLHDPHPGHLIREHLAEYIPQIEYIEWEMCGHYPWLERAVRDEFLEKVRTWLKDHC
jgi:pimeloyl-ACP methyl ester carboxylesterase